MKKIARPWRVLSGISALGDRNTFMPAQKRHAGEMSQSGKKQRKEIKL
jgi:hypothetical protein